MVDGFTLPALLRLVSADAEEDLGGQVVKTGAGVVSRGVVPQ